MRALIDPPPLDRRPDSEDPRIFGGRFDENPMEPGRPGGWDHPRLSDKARDYRDVIEAWRLQQPRPAPEKTKASKEEQKQ